MKKTFTEWCRIGSLNRKSTKEISAEINKALEYLNDWAQWQVFYLNKEKESWEKYR